MSENKQPSWHPSVEQYIGKVIDQYVLVEPLGQGGMGLIFKAEQRRIKRFVAVKLLSPDHMSNEVSLKRLQREATSMANLKHPHIATLFDMVISKEAQPYLIMELIEGISLKQQLRDHGKLTPQRAVNILLQVCEAMEYAHANGLIHRDLKPDNIMLTSDVRPDFVKILDFGIAKSAEPNTEALTHQGQMIGSPLYMSPEQCVGKALPDQRTDIYSLGVILYECLTGDVPFRGQSFVETAYLKSTEQPAPFPEDLKYCPQLESITLACLAPTPDDRPASMTVVREQLEQVRRQFEGTPVNPLPVVQAAAPPPQADAPLAAPQESAPAADVAQSSTQTGSGTRSYRAVSSEVAKFDTTTGAKEVAPTAAEKTTGGWTVPAEPAAPPKPAPDASESALVPPSLSGQMPNVADLSSTLVSAQPALTPSAPAAAPARSPKQLVLTAVAFALMAVAAGGAFLAFNHQDKPVDSSKATPAPVQETLQAPAASAPSGGTSAGSNARSTVIPVNEKAATGSTPAAKGTDNQKRATEQRKRKSAVKKAVPPRKAKAAQPQAQVQQPVRKRKRGLIDKIKGLRRVVDEVF
ncbi:MAG: serine/threonine-protein kinase [Candidatus Obscuribacterales bacterium]